MRDLPGPVTGTVLFDGDDRAAVRLAAELRNLPALAADPVCPITMSCLLGDLYALLADDEGRVVDPDLGA